MDPAAPVTVADAIAHEGFVRGLARGVLGADDRVDDVVAETLWAAVDRGPRHGSLRAWLAAVVRRRARDVQRRDARRRRRETAVARPEATPSTAELVAREDVRRRLVDALLALDPLHREALVLRYHDDLPPRELAVRLGIPVETARSRVKRGLEVLRARLDAHAGGDRRRWALVLGAWAGPDAEATTPARAARGGRFAVAGGALVVGLVAIRALRSDGPASPTTPEARPPVEVGARGGDAAGSGAPATATPSGLAASPRRDPAAEARAAGSGGIDGRVRRDGRPIAASVEVRRVGDVLPEAVRTGGDPVDRRAWLLALGATTPPLASRATATDGAFTLRDLAAGVYEARVTIAGAAPQAFPVVILRAGEHRDASIALVEGRAAVDVVVQRADGTPVAATVGVAAGDGWAWVHGPLPRRTDAAGHVRLEGLAEGKATIVAAVDGEDGVREVAIVLPQAGPVTIGPPARPPVVGVLTGRVVRAGSGEPVAGVWVHATRARTDASAWTYADRSVPTDAAGRFRVEGLGIGFVTAFVQGDGFLTPGLADVGDDAPDPLAKRTDAAGVLDVELAVEPAAPVRGRVVDEEGAPIAGAVVELDPRGPFGGVRTGLHPPERGVLNARVEAVSAPDGTFALSAPIPGHAYAVCARAPGRRSVVSRAVTAADAAQGVVLALPRSRGAAWADVLVVEVGTRRPIPGARVVIWRASGPGAFEGVDEVRAGADGLARVGPYPSLVGLVATSEPASDEATAFAERPEPVPLDGDRGVDPVLVPRAMAAARLLLAIEGPDEIDFATAVVQVWGPGLEAGMEQRGGIDAAGRVTVRVPSASRYRVRVHATASGAPFVGEVEGLAGVSTPVRVVLARGP